MRRFSQKRQCKFGADNLFSKRDNIFSFQQNQKLSNLHYIHSLCDLRHQWVTLHLGQSDHLCCQSGTNTRSPKVTKGHPLVADNGDRKALNAAHITQCSPSHYIHPWQNKTGADWNKWCLPVRCKPIGHGGCRPNHSGRCCGHSRSLRSSQSKRIILDNFYFCILAHCRLLLSDRCDQYGVSSKTQISTGFARLSKVVY